MAPAMTEKLENKASFSVFFFFLQLYNVTDVEAEGLGSGSVSKMLALQAGGHEFNLQNPCVGKPGTVMQACNASPEKTEARAVELTSHPAWMNLHAQASERPCLKTKAESS